jgi:hypothetical protein
MILEQFRPSPESEARILLLVARFSGPSRALEGRTKLAKLDFFLRYPQYLKRALEKRAPGAGDLMGDVPQNIDSRMVRYRYGPWDPSYFAVLGRLIGKGLVIPHPFARGIGYRVTEKGRETAAAIAAEPAWQDTWAQTGLLRKFFDLTGTTLKSFVYETFPEVAGAEWGNKL